MSLPFPQSSFLTLAEATGVEPARPVRNRRFSKPLYYRSTTPPIPFRVRSERDLNPRYQRGITVFKTAAFDRSAIAPLNCIAIIPYLTDSCQVLEEEYFFAQLLFFQGQPAMRKIQYKTGSSRKQHWLPMAQLGNNFHLIRLRPSHFYAENGKFPAF